MWKIFGMESSIGKKIHKMYNQSNPKPSINYPKVNVKQR